MHLSPISFAAALEAALGTSHIAVWLVCVLSLLLLIAAQFGVRFFWLKNAAGSNRTIGTERAEKSCDAVLSFCALLIPATLGLLTWLNEKVGPGSHAILLDFALLYFFVLLTFTAYLRFNLLWTPSADFKVDSASGISFGRWLTMVMCCITFGLVLLSLPVLELGSGWLKLKDASTKDSQTNGGSKEIQCSTLAVPSPIVHTECNCSAQPEVQQRRKNGSKSTGPHPRK
jgi:hypothetical protein